MAGGKKGGYVFGPVPSRRLGRSLGIDLVPFKVCSYDCVYCQVGFTTDKTTRQQDFVPVDSVIEELKTRLDSEPDYVTLSGSGEPTLYSSCGELIERIKRITDIPVAVITNGSMLCFPDVRRQISAADLVIPSLDAADEETFRKINRPCGDITFEKMLGGLVDFRREFTGAYWLEVFLVTGINDSDEHIEKLAGVIEKILPDKVQLNTVSRPTADRTIRPVPAEKLKKIAKKIYKNAEVIADYSRIAAVSGISAEAEDVLDMLRRRPCSTDDVASGLEIGKNQAIKYIEQLLAKKKITADRQGDKIYYKAVIQEEV